MRTEEEKREAQRKANAKYRASPRGKAKTKERGIKWRKSLEFKEWNRKYLSSSHGKSVKNRACKKHRTTDIYRINRIKNAARPEVRIAHKISKAKYRASIKGKEKEANHNSLLYVKESHRRSSRKWHMQPKNKAAIKPLKWARNLMDKYGVTVEQYNFMLVSQNGGCAICGGVNENGRKLHVDHNHATNKIRGLVCHGCNVSLGLLKEDPMRMQKMVEYICRHENICAAIIDGAGI